MKKTPKTTTKSDPYGLGLLGTTADHLAIRRRKLGEFLHRQLLRKILDASEEKEPVSSD